MSSFYTESELATLGLKSCGTNVLISRRSSIFSPHLVSIGDNVRIDDFCILSGIITLHNNIHISAYTALYGAYEIEFEDFTGASPRCTIFSATDDFSGDYLVGPIHPEHTTHLETGKVLVKKYTQIGANTVVMPNLTIGEGCAVGCMSFVNKSLDPWGIYAGIPVKRIKNRSKELLKLLY